jgi:hypothetical protein
MMQPNPLFAAREAERMARNSSAEHALLLNYLALGCMAMMAFPCAIQALKAAKEVIVGEERHRGR